MVLPLERLEYTGDLLFDGFRPLANGSGDLAGAQSCGKPERQPLALGGVERAQQCTQPSDCLVSEHQCLGFLLVRGLQALGQGIPVQSGASAASSVYGSMASDTKNPDGEGYTAWLIV